MVGGGRRSKGDRGEMVPAMREVNSPTASMTGSTSGGLTRSERGSHKGCFPKRVCLQRPMLGQLRVRLSLEEQMSGSVN